MPLHWFNPSVPVRGDRPGLTINVNNVETAALELLKWTGHGPKWREAARVCGAGLADEMPPDDCRKSFLEAAKEEGVLRPFH
jgi:hypothetical protein